MIDNLKLKARAIVAVRKRKAKQEQERLEVERATQASEDALIERLLSTLTLPTPKDGKDGRDAPTLSDILGAIELPEAKIVHTEKTIVQEVNPTDMEVFIRGLLPEIQQEDKPAVEQITIDVSEDKLEGFVTKKDFNKALERIQDAITANQSGGGGLREMTLVNVIEADSDVTILDSQLQIDKINIILVLTADITVTLPNSSASKIVWVQQGYEGSGTFTVCKQ